VTEPEILKKVVMARKYRKTFASDMDQAATDPVDPPCLAV